MKSEPIQVSIWKGNAEVIFKLNEQNVIPVLCGIALILFVHSCLGDKSIA